MGRGGQHPGVGMGSGHSCALLSQVRGYLLTCSEYLLPSGPPRHAAGVRHDICCDIALPVRHAELASSLRWTLSSALYGTLMHLR